MRYLLAAMWAFLLFWPLANMAVAAETKKVCVKQMDAKTKKEREVCKNVKIHKKLEGTKVPEKK